MAVADSFHPDFYVAMATVLPLLLLTTGLMGNWLRHGIRWHLFPLSFRQQHPKLFWRHIRPILFAVFNSLAEVLCLIVLFNRSTNTSVNVVIWIGFSVSWMFVLSLFVIFVANQPSPHVPSWPNRSVSNH